MKTLPEGRPSPTERVPDGLSDEPNPSPQGEVIPDPTSKRPDRFSVLTVAPTFFFADYGCHVRILEEIRVLQSMGHRPVLCSYPSGQDVAGIEIRRATGGPWTPSVKVGPARRKLFLDPLLSLKAAQVAAEIKPDIVHAHLHDGALVGFPVSRATHAPLVFDFQGSLTGEMLDHGFLSRRSPLYHPWRLLEKAINGMADAIITSTANSAGLLVKRFGCPARKIFTVADCVNTDMFAPRWMLDSSNGHVGELEALRRRLGVPSGYKVVVYLGLLQEYQGISHLLRAAKEVAERHLDVHFLIMGYPGLEKYRNMADELGISNRVTFPGRIPYGQAPLHLALGDVAVSPKMSETEGNGKLLNYMAMGLPTVTYDTPVSREILGDLGVFARTGDPHALAGELESALFNERAALAQGEQLRARAVSTYSWIRGGKLIQEIYERLLP
ncbi:MAG: glycosyltransferase family 4 protein [Chloroflexi bacterium]|nr:glycosyltransferase family 4 protein [Chloroflexota bacterium]